MLTPQKYLLCSKDVKFEWELKEKCSGFVCLFRKVYIQMQAGIRRGVNY
jgi:hypothetical protein